MGWSEKGPQAERQKDGEVEQEEIAFYFGCHHEGIRVEPQRKPFDQGGYFEGQGRQEVV